MKYRFIFVCVETVTPRVQLQAGVLGTVPRMRAGTIAAIVLPFFIAEWLAYLVAAAVALLYAGANFVVFWFTAQKKYAAVEC